MHAHGVASRYVVPCGTPKCFDLNSCPCSEIRWSKIQFDATNIFPQGFHPHWQWCLPDRTGAAPSNVRAFTGDKCYYSSFKKSIFVRSNTTSDHTTRKELMDRDVALPDTESNDDDAFASDVLALGNVLEKHFDQVGSCYRSLTHR